MCCMDEEIEVVAQWLGVALCEKLVRSFDAREGREAHGSGVNKGAGVIDEIAPCRRRAENDACSVVSRHCVLCSPSAAAEAEQSLTS